MPAETVSAPDLDDSAFENELAIDTVLLVNLYVHKKRSLAVDPVGR